MHSSSELRVGVVGAGMVAGEHVRAYTASPGSRVAAAADPVQAKAERLAADVGAAVVPDLDAILALGVDVVSVCTPPLTHCRIAVRVVGNGAPGMRLVPVGTDADALLVAGFVASVQAGEILEPCATGEDGLRALEVALAGYASADQGAVVITVPRSPVAPPDH